MPEAVPPDAAGSFVVEGIRYRTHPDVYDPSDDTVLLLRAVADLRPGRLLEVGTGAGLVAIAAARRGHAVVATDLHANALRLARSNAALNRVDVRFVRADLIRGLRIERFEAVVFNPPYLPTAPTDRVPGPLNDAFDGGPDGLAALERFVALLPAESPPAYLVVSSLQDVAARERALRGRGLRATEVAHVAVPNERLAVVRLDAARKG